MAKTEFLGNISVRIVLGLVVGSIGVLLAGICFYSLAVAWGEMSESRRTTRIATASQHLVQAYSDARTERGDILVGLGRDGPTMADVAAPTIEKNRAIKENLRIALSALDRDDVAGAGPLLATVQDSNAALQDLWVRCEPAIHHPKTERPAELVQAWDSAANKRLDAITALADKLEGVMKGGDLQIDHMVAIKQAATVARLSGGQSVLMFAPILSGDRNFPVDQQVKEARLRGETSAAWSIVRHLSSEPRTPPAVADAVAQAEKAFFDQGAEYRLRVTNALTKGEPLDIGVSEWLSAADPQLNSVSGVGAAAMSAVVQRAEQRVSTADTQLWLNGLALLSVLAYLAFGAWLLTRRVSRPIGQLTEVIGQYAEQKYDAPVAVIETQDELGRMCKALSVLAENGRRVQEAQRQRAEEQRQVGERTKRVVALCQAFDEQVRGNLGNADKATAGLAQAAAAMSAAATQTSSETQTVASALEQATAGIGTVASATDELSSSVREIGRQTAQSTSVAADAVNKVEKTNQAIGGLATVSEKIGEIVSLINGIAAQTNLLALNATIEAARAGEAGKGFAVVAGEVKNLANQTAKATDEIANQVQQIQTMTHHAVDGIGEIGVVIQEMSGITTSIASAIEEQGAATQEIARNVNEVSMAAQTITASTSGLATQARQSRAVAEEVTGATALMEKQVVALRDEVARFLDNMRVA